MDTVLPEWGNPDLQRVWDISRCRLSGGTALLSQPQTGWVDGVGLNCAHDALGWHCVIYEHTAVRITSLYLPL